MDTSETNIQSCGGVPGFPRSEVSIEDYTIGWICVLQEEYETACRMLDEEFDGPETSEANDNNTYVFGRIGGHRVVIGCLPGGRYGTSSAASVARDMVRSFPNLRFAMMVGIGGGAPTKERDIRLGDVVVSEPQGGLGGVIQYDFGKRLSDGRFQRTSQLNAPPEALLGAIPEMRRRHNDPRKPDKIAEHLKLMHDMPGYQCPVEDRLYRADYEHKGGKCCQNCESDGLEERPKRETSREVTVHYGIIASANSVLKNAVERNQYANDPDLNVLCFEMEAGGLMNNFPCLVIRGICDYADSHKNDEWHKYAALTAAAYGRELLNVLKPMKVAVIPWVGKMETFLAGVQEGVSDTSRKADDILRHQQNQEHKEILEWLTPIDYAPQQSDIIKQRAPGTGQWLLGSAAFQAWLETDKQTLFCPGIPGAGKTVLSAIVVNDLYTRFRSDASIGIAYLYCNFRRQHEQKLEDLLASLLKQLVQQQSTIPDSVKVVHDRHRGIRTRPLIDGISRALHSVAAIFARAFIIVDALDECQVTDGCRARLLSEIFHLQTKTGAKLFATSRFNNEIAELFKGSLYLEIHAHSDDVRRYLDGHLDDHVSQLPACVRNNPELRDDIKTEIINAVKGMFLLAKLYFDSLSDKTTEKRIRFALKNLPTGSEALDSAYEEVMERINGQQPGFRTLARQVLSWITCAQRPLTTLELRHALAVEIGESELDGKNLPEIGDMVAVCAGLVTVDEQSDIIRLVHYTTQHFLETHMSSLVAQNWVTTAGVRNDVATAMAQKNMTVTCVNYLIFDRFESGFCLTDEEFQKRIQRNPLYDYAARNWGHHGRAASIEAEPLILKLLCSETKVSASSQAMMTSASYSGYSQRSPRRMMGGHLAAYFGLREVTIALLEHQHDLDVEDTYARTPLSYAAENGHEAVVKLLLDTNSVDVNSKDSRSRQTPLSWATRNGHEAVVKLLLAKDGVDVNSKDSSGHTPLLWAARNGHGALVKLLLAKDGVDVNSKDNYNGHTPLLWATRNGHEAVVKLLLAKDAIDVNYKDSSGQTPLSWPPAKKQRR